MEKELKIIQVKIKDIIPYKNNAKKHDQVQINNVAESIKQFGFRQPIVLDKDNVIIIGHCRWLASKKLKLDTVPCHYAEDLTEEQVIKLRNLDNKLNESEWDYDLLKDQVINIDFQGFDIDWGIPDIESEPQEITEDIPPEVDEVNEPICKLGDIWQLGEHRLMCGDSTDKETVAKLMNGEKADMVFTDPPYGMNLDTDFSSMKSKLFKGKTGGAEYSEVIGDNADFKPELITTIFNNFYYCKEIFTWGADYYAELLPNKNNGSWVVWDKRLDDSADKMYGSCFELCWSKAKHKRDIARVKWAGIFGMENQDTKTRVHPTQKPVNLVSWFLTRFSNDNDLIVDLYGGSGSTLIACEQLNRKCYAMELDPKYCDVIIKRWENLTNKKAVKL